jgi:hypothetical protein
MVLLRHLYLRLMRRQLCLVSMRPPWLRSQVKPFIRRLHQVGQVFLSLRRSLQLMHLRR